MGMFSNDEPYAPVSYVTSLERRVKELAEREVKLVALLKRTDSACIYASLFMAAKDNTTEAIFWQKKGVKIEATLSELGEGV
jgi:hypothetical protein